MDISSSNSCGFYLWRRWRVQMKAFHLSRLSVLALLVLGALPCALRDSGPAVAGESGELVVLDWPGYAAETFGTDVKSKNPGVKENIEIGETDAERSTELNARH